jgi:hypothetical protein
VDYLQKFQAIVEEVFFLNYVNNVESKINRSDLIYTSYTSKYHMHLIFSYKKISQPRPIRRQNIPTPTDRAAAFYSPPLVRQQPL